MLGLIESEGYGVGTMGKWKSIPHVERSLRSSRHTLSGCMYSTVHTLPIEV